MIDFGNDFESILEPSWEPKSTKNRSERNLKSEQAQIRKILKIIGRGGVFEDPANRKAIKNRQKIVLKVDENKDPQNDRFWERFWTGFGGQVGSEKGAKTGQDRPRQPKISQVELS